MTSKRGEEEGGRGLCLSWWGEGSGEACHSNDCDVGTLSESALSLLLLTEVALAGDISAVWDEEGKRRTPRE